MQFPFKGYSGCGTSLVQEGDFQYVRKSTADPLYISRLKDQAQKQKRMSMANSLEFVQIPRVTKEDDLPDSYAFEMDYFRCDDAISFLQKATREDLELVTDRLLQFIEYNIEQSTEMVVSKEIIVRKYEDVKNKFLQNYQFDTEVTNRILQRAESIIMSIDEELRIPVGYCHGDLTFSNILITKDTKQVVLVDWLDSFVETPLHDIVKLRQDTKYYWSLNSYRFPFDRIKMMIIMDHLDKKIDSYFSRCSFYRKNYFLFQLLNLLRICPYVIEKEDILFLIKILDTILSEM